MDIVPFLSTVCRGGLWGLLMGTGLGTFSGILSLHRKDPPRTLLFKHPITQQVVELDPYDLDDGAGVVPMLRRIHRTLHMEPSIRDEAKRQFIVILARVRNFYNTLKMYMDRPDVLRYKIQTRKCATIASQSIRDFEAYIWDSPEIEGIANDLDVVQQAVIEKMLSLKNKHVSQFEELCELAHLDPKASNLRKIILHVTNGLAEADVLVDPESGELFDKARVCTLNSYVAEQARKLSLAWGSMDDAAAKKADNERQTGLPCVAGPMTERTLEMWVDKCQSLAAFRRVLLREMGQDIRAIHLLKWDGTPRSSMLDVKWAVCHYPPTAQGMSKVTKALIGVGVGAAIVAAGVYVGNKHGKNVVSKGENFVKATGDLFGKKGKTVEFTKLLRAVEEPIEKIVGQMKHGDFTQKYSRDRKAYRNILKLLGSIGNSDSSIKKQVERQIDSLDVSKVTSDEVQWMVKFFHDEFIDRTKTTISTSGQFVAFLEDDGRTEKIARIIRKYTRQDLKSITGDSNACGQLLNQLAKSHGFRFPQTIGSSFCTILRDKFIGYADAGYTNTIQKLSEKPKTYTKIRPPPRSSSSSSSKGAMPIYTTPDPQFYDD